MKRLINAILWTTVALSAQDTPRGHWTGTVTLPAQKLGLEVDIDKGAQGWIGSISIPAQNASGLPMGTISFENGKCVFHLIGVPGDPTFTGTLSEDGKTMSGTYTQGPGTFPFKLTRGGEPKVEQEKSSPAVAQEFLGDWEGKLDGGGLRLVLKLSNEAAGSKAVLGSPDQGGAEVPVTSIDQKATKLTLDVKMVGGIYVGEINKEGTELNGTWTQGSKTSRLSFKRAATAADKKP